MSANYKWLNKVKWDEHGLVPVIASGGVHDIKDVEALCAVQDDGIEGVICGRSIYEGSLDLQLAQERADELSEQQYIDNE